MIKLDIISGFLGVGKTTLIKKYLKTLSNADEKVILIENDFGNIGIDKDILKVGDLDIYEINKGCLCCSLKVTFVSTLIEIAEEIKPDRVILEPSGIFILSEIFELFRYTQISDNFTINSVITVVDGLHFHTYKNKYGNFLYNQIDNAGTIMVSKVGLMEEQQTIDVVHELTDMFPEKEVIAEVWDELTDKEILSIFKGDDEIYGKVLVGDALKKKKKERAHTGFSSYSFFRETPLSQALLKDKLEKLNTKGYGDIVRAKGFVKMDEDNAFLEFHYVNGEIEIIKNFKKDLKAGLCFIGRNLDKKSLDILFQ